MLRRGRSLMVLTAVACHAPRPEPPAPRPSPALEHEAVASARARESVCDRATRDAETSLAFGRIQLSSSGDAAGAWIGPPEFVSPDGIELSLEGCIRTKEELEYESCFNAVTLARLEVHGVTGDDLRARWIRERDHFHRTQSRSKSLRPLGFPPVTISTTG